MCLPGYLMSVCVWGCVCKKVVREVDFVQEVQMLRDI